MKLFGLPYRNTRAGETATMGETTPRRDDDSKLFPPTRWSLVAGSRNAESAGKALSELCHIYWFPVYAYFRSMDRDHHDSQDLAQGFFARILERGDFAKADPDRGRLRTFLCVAARRYVISSDRRERCSKRGGNAVTVSLDSGKAELLYRNTPCHQGTPETCFDRHWATAVLEEATGRLASEYRARSKGELFAALYPYLGRHARNGDQGETATALGMGIGAFRMAVSRFRQRYGEILRETVADTLADPAKVEEEIDYLLQLFRG